MEYVFTEKAPKPVGPYSQAVKVGNWVYVSGQIPIDPGTGEVIKGDFSAAVRRVLENVKAIVEAAGGGLESVVKVMVYLTDIGKFSEFNKIYAEYFSTHRPARMVIEVSRLPKDVEVAVDAVAYVGSAREG